MAKAIDEMDYAKNKYATDLFNRIPEEKQKRILDTAIIEFSQNGFHNANVNTIAENADISIGSLYKYFATKEDIFLLIIEYSKKKLETLINSVIKNSNGTIIDKIEQLLRLALTYSRSEPELTKLYNVFTSEGNSELALTLSENLENVSAKAYKNIIKEAQKKGEIRKDIDPGVLALIMDNQLMMTQFSSACDYYIERYNIFLGKRKAKDDEFFISNTMKIMKLIFGKGKEQ